MAAIVLCLAFLFAVPIPGAQAAEHAAPLVVGGLFAQSGPEAKIGKAGKLAAELAVRQINSMGGILGRPVKLITGDTESSPSVALRQARQLVENDHALALIGPSATAAGLAVKAYTEKRQVPVIMTTADDAVLAGGRAGSSAWTFTIAPRTAAAVEKICEYLRGKNIKKIGVLYAKDAFGQDGLDAFRESAGKYGIEVVAAEACPPRETDFSAQAATLQAAGPQAAVVWALGPDGATMARNLAALPGSRPLLVQCPAQAGPEYLQQAGEAASGTVLPGTKLMAPECLPDEDPQKLVIETFLKAYEQDGQHTRGPRNIQAGYAYDAMLLLRAGLEKAGKADAAALRNALENLHKVVGVSGIYDFSSQDHNGLDADSLIMLIVDSGRYKLAP